MRIPRRKLFLAIMAALVLLVSYPAYKVVRWKMYVWLPDYISQRLATREKPATRPVHVMFLFVDHYEPGLGKEGVLKSREWLAWRP